MPTILLNKIKPGGKTLTNLKVGSTEVKYVKRGDGKLFYDTLSYYSYGTPSVSLSYPSGNTSAAGGTKSPTVTYSQSKTPYGHSGTNYSASTLNSGASSITYSLNNTSKGASINATTGVVTWAANETLNVREVVVTVTVTINSKKGTGTFTLKQDADSVKSTTISLDSNKYTVSGSGAPYGGGSCTLTAKVTKTWVSGNKTYDKPTLSSNQIWLTLGSINSSYNATATFASHTNTSQRSAVVTATYSGATSKTLTLYQKPLPVYTATITLTSLLNDQVWMLVNGTPTYNNTSRYAVIIDNTITESFGAGQGITVNAAAGGAQATVSNGGVVYVYVFSNGAWTVINSFTHNANSSYTKTFS